MLFYYIITLVAVVIGFIAVIIIFGGTKRNNNPILKTLLHIIVSIDILWFIGVLLGLLKQSSFLSHNSTFYFFIEVILLSCLFVLRFLLLSSFFLLIEQLTKLEFLKKIISSFTVITIVTSTLWVFAWLEIPLMGSRGLLETLMVYTDILIIVSILAASVFLLSKSRDILNTEIMITVKILCYIFISFFILSFIKWLISSILGNFQFYYERVLIHSLLIGMNISIAWWSLRHSDSILGEINYKLELNKNQFKELVTKYEISKREREIIPLICMGKSNNEIAKQLFISIETVKDHNHSIYKKVGVKNRNQLTNLFIDSVNK